MVNVDKISISKFEEFFINNYRKEVFRILEKYPEEKSLIIDYNKLEIFDLDLADLLIETPNDVLNAANLAIKNIDPLIKGAELIIKVNNFPNIVSFDNVDSGYIGQFITLEGTVFNVDKPRPQLDIGVFECRGCMRVHDVKQETHKNTMFEPSLCSECGGKSFRLLEDESKFRESQLITLGDENSSKRIDILLLHDDCSYDDYVIGTNLKITGTLKAIKLKEGFDYFLEANLIEKLDYFHSDISEDFKKGDRNSSEYKIWQKGIIERDKLCQCCGGHKHLQAHHIFGYKNHPNYRVNLENGITLCKWCHGKYHSYYGKEANPTSLIKFIKRFGGNHE